MAIYFTKNVDDAIVRYNLERDFVKANDIYMEHIHVPMSKLVENIYNKYKFIYIALDSKSAMEDCLSFLIMNLSKFNPTNNKSSTGNQSIAFGYFSTIAKNYFIFNNTKTYKENNRTISIDAPDEDIESESNTLCDFMEAKMQSQLDLKNKSEYEQDFIDSNREMIIDCYEWLQKQPETKPAEILLFKTLIHIINDNEIQVYRKPGVWSNLARCIKLSDIRNTSEALIKRMTYNCLKRYCYYMDIYWKPIKNDVSRDYTSRDDLPRKIPLAKEYSRPCPICKEIIYRKTRAGFITSLRLNSKCYSCARELRYKNVKSNNYDSEFKRNCPKCGSILLYANKYIFLRSVKKNSKCYKCTNRTLRRKKKKFDCCC
jgi:hypothetical protein